MYCARGGQYPITGRFVNLQPAFVWAIHPKGRFGAGSYCRGAGLPQRFPGLPGIWIKRLSFTIAVLGISTAICSWGGVKEQGGCQGTEKDITLCLAKQEMNFYAGI